MARYLNLQIPKSCHEDWDRMQPRQKGKFCLSCQKQVIDFTAMTDSEVVAYFKKYTGNTCGRFTSEQLDRDLLIPNKPLPWIRYFFQITLPAFLFSFKGNTQKVNEGEKPIFPLTIHDRVDTAVDKGSALSKRFITVNGTVIDDSGHPVAGATIIVNSTGQTTISDTAGGFTLKEVEMPAKLEVMAIGFESKVELIKPVSSNAVQTKVQVKLSGQTLGEVVVVAGYVLPSRKKRKSEKKAICATPTPALTVYPNPVTSASTIHIKWQGLTSGQYFIEVYNIQGALMRSEEIGIENWMTEYPLRHQLQTAGNYIIKLINKKTGRYLSQQFIVR